MYGQLLGVRDSQREAFLVAAETLRARADLPRDLRASAGRTRASVLFQQAASLLESLRVGLEAPWPAEAFAEVIDAACRACDAYEAALAESSEPSLCHEVAPHCPEWPAAVEAVGKAAVEVRKLRAELRFREVKWHSRQAERARAVGAAAARPGGAGDSGLRAADELREVGLPPTIEEEEVWALAARAAETLVKECGEGGETARHDSDGALRALRSRGQALQMLCLKDLAVACAMSHKLDEAVEHMLAALRLRVDDPGTLAEGAVEQVQAAAQGLATLCGRELPAASTQQAAHAAASRAAELAQALADFGAWQRDSRGGA